MTSHHVAIAKASFSAALLRQKPAQISKPNISLFYSLLESSINQCSPHNVQTCKHWLLQNFLQSTAQVEAFIKLLVAISSSYKTQPQDGTVSRPSVKRKRLHILYLMSDLLHHLRRPNSLSNKPDFYSSTAASFFNGLVDLMSLAAQFRDSPKHKTKLYRLIDIWAQASLFSSQNLSAFKNVIENPRPTKLLVEGVEKERKSGDADAIESAAAVSKEQAWLVPEANGSSSVPWYDLPASSMLPHISPNDNSPIPTHLMKPLYFNPGPASAALTTAVQDLIAEANRLYSASNLHREKSAELVDFDAMGTAIWRSESSKEPQAIETYFGWSREFCQRMSHRVSGNGFGHIRRTSRGRSSEERSFSPDARRYQRSSESSKGRSRSQSPRQRGLGQHSRRRRSISFSLSRSRSPASRVRRPRSISRSRSSSRSYTPPSPRRADEQQSLGKVQTGPPLPSPFIASQGTHQTANVLPFPPYQLDSNGIPIPPLPLPNQIPNLAGQGLVWPPNLTSFPFPGSIPIPGFALPTPPPPIAVQGAPMPFQGQRRDQNKGPTDPSSNDQPAIRQDVVRDPRLQPRQQ